MLNTALLTKSTCRLLRMIMTFVVIGVAPAAHAQLKVGDICRVKGQEENTLQGLGLVVGLNGTGDGDLKPAARALASMLSVMGNPVGKEANSRDPLAELKNAKNIALVNVTATVPSAGGRQGDAIECVISSIGSAKSLAGGILLSAPLVGPARGSTRVYAFAQGAVQLDAGQPATTARIHNGCRLEEDFHNAFVQDGKVTLVIDRHHASFTTAQEVADAVNTLEGSYRPAVTKGRSFPVAQAQAQVGRQPTTSGGGAYSGPRQLAKALNQVSVEVNLPNEYLEDPVVFLMDVLKTRLPQLQSEARVVVNERTGSIIVGAEVEVGAAAITHKNMVVETGAATPGQFVQVPADGGQISNTKLKALVESLNALKVPPADMIEILKGLDRNGKLYGKLVIQ